MTRGSEAVRAGDSGKGFAVVATDVQKLAKGMSETSKEIKAGNQSLIVGLVGFASVAFLALTFNSTGFSMNAMRSVFSSIWFAILPIPNKGKEKVD